MNQSPTARRTFLRGLVGAGTVAAAAGYTAAAAHAATSPAAVTDPLAQLPAVPFYGAHQAGILPPAQRQAAVIAFDATAGNRAELTALLQELTSRIAFLTVGGTPTPAGIMGPPSDSGILGPVVVPDGLDRHRGRRRLRLRRPLRPGRSQACAT